jgi:hypothetical protein
MGENIEITPKDLKNHFNNLINSLVALCPSHNYVSQFLTFLPDEYSMMYDGFPEFLGDREFREQVKILLGLNFGPNIELLPKSFGKKLQQITKLASEMLNDPIINEWSEFLKDVREDDIPNPKQEWALAKLRAATGDPTHGKVAHEILKILQNSQNAFRQSSEIQPLNSPPFVGLSFEELQIKSQVSKNELLVTLKWLVTNLKLIQQFTQPQTDGSEQITYIFNPNIQIEWLNNI